MRIWPRRTPNRASPVSPFWNSTSPAASCWVWQRPDIRCSSSAPRSANIGFIFRITANSACLLIAMPSRAKLEIVKVAVAKYRLAGKCVISHITLQHPGLFLGSFERFPHSGISSSHSSRPRRGTAGQSMPSCPIWKCRHESPENRRQPRRRRDRRRRRLLLVIGIPSGFMTSAIQARVERETGYRLTHRRHDPDRRLAVAACHAERRHAAGSRRTATAAIG